MAALALGLSACTDLTSTTATSSEGVAATEIDYSACATDDSADQSANVDRTGTGNFPAVSGEDTPVIAAGKGAEPTNKVLVKTLKQGDGTLVCPGAKVKVNYVGALWNGTVFDSSYQKGQPIEFSLAQVVKGWGYGLAHATWATASSWSSPPPLDTELRVTPRSPRTRRWCSSSTSWARARRTLRMSPS